MIDIDESNINRGNMKATARAFSNIAFIKYWGNRDHELRLPLNSTISMNLDGVATETTVTWRDDITDDTLTLNGEPAGEAALLRVRKHLDVVRQRLGMRQRAVVESQNNFPMGAGIASSASAFAALTTAAVEAAGKSLTERELSTIARRGSGSASRSIPGGFVVWHEGTDDASSFAESIAPPDHWDLVDLIAIVSAKHKKTGSQEGHRTAETSELQQARILGANERFEICKNAVLEKDFKMFAEIVEYDSNLMHAVMMTSRPALLYWQPPTIEIMQRVQEMRAGGLNVCYTLDAGPNVHCICVRDDLDAVRAGLADTSGVVDMRIAAPGGAAHIVTD